MLNLLLDLHNLFMINIFLFFSVPGTLKNKTPRKKFIIVTPYFTFFIFIINWVLRDNRNFFDFLYYNHIKGSFKWNPYSVCVWFNYIFHFLKNFLNLFHFFFTDEVKVLNLLNVFTTFLYIFFRYYFKKQKVILAVKDRTYCTT